MQASVCTGRHWVLRRYRIWILSPGHSDSDYESKIQPGPTSWWFPRISASHSAAPTTDMGTSVHRVIRGAAVFARRTLVMCLSVKPGCIAIVAKLVWTDSHAAERHFRVPCLMYYHSDKYILNFVNFSCYSWSDTVKMLSNVPVREHELYLATFPYGNIRFFPNSEK